MRQGIQVSIAKLSWIVFENGVIVVISLPMAALLMLHDYLMTIVLWLLAHLADVHCELMWELMPWRSIRFLLSVWRQEPLGQFQPNLVGNTPDGDSDLFIYIGWPLLGPNKVQNKENSDKKKKIFSWTTSQNPLIFGMEHPKR